MGDGLTPIYARAVAGKDIVRVPGTEFIPDEVITGRAIDWLGATPGGRALLGDLPAGASRMGAAFGVTNGPQTILAEARMPPALVDPELVKGKGLYILHMRCVRHRE